jgi:hypothetical protein
MSIHGHKTKITKKVYCELAFEGILFDLKFQCCFLWFPMNSQVLLGCDKFQE